ncbi:unnamed protein product [Psylliodes chrysocephalus]|uniref:Glucose-methanol-choline oxidoreductase N-terminal domain-containing protein n=1 Tax=Psylliodes chrysocephalus TaxID=3402493 RepID=A0A9P0GIS9_9CUCU|nr:unnamed protein product [Psylliodes chrysocephala]
MNSLTRTFLVCFVFRLAVSQSKTVDELLALIIDGDQKSAAYQLPTDAKQYAANDTTINDYGEEYDFVIIGAGVTGCAIANRLSEIGKWKVLLIEAGNFSDNGLVRIPTMFALNLFSDYNWGFKTVPQNTSCLCTTDQTCQVPRGKGVGGTSLINALQYVRANPQNFNLWAKILQDSSWSYTNVLKYFKKSENFTWTNPKAPVDLKYHGTAGLLNVQHKVPDHPLNDIFIEANKQLNYAITDYNSPNQIGGTIMQLDTKSGTRDDLGTAYITPFLSRSNLRVLTQSYVTKIEIDKTTKTAKSVIFTNEGNTYRVRAKMEVILSAGAISSPQILMLSGVGPKEHLKDMEIDLIEDLQVGSHLKDHALGNPFFFSSNLTIPVESLKQQITEYLKGSGPLTSSGIQAQGIGFYNVNCKTCTVPNVAIFLDAGNEVIAREKQNQNFNDECFESFSKNPIPNGVRFFFLLLNSKSSGTIRLKSNNPFDYPLIDPRLLSDTCDRDISTMYLGIKHIFKIAETLSFKNINLTFAGQPLPACKDFKFKSKQYWYCYLRHVVQTAYHPMCTCPMGINKYTGSVVDSNLKVFGVKKLRVADASVFPTPIAGYPSINCLLIGEKISDVIKKEYS